MRGSIPVRWSQAPNLQYKSPIHLAPAARTDPAFVGHVERLVADYEVRAPRGGVCGGVCVWGGSLAGWLAGCLFGRLCEGSSPFFFWK